MIAPSPSALQLHAGSSLFLSPNPYLLLRHGFPRSRKIWRSSMCLATRTLIKDGVLRINGREALTRVPENVVVSPSKTDDSAFLGAVSDRKGSRFVFKLGVLRDHRLLCLFRYKIWWMIPRIGNSGSDIPIETQMLLLEAREDLGVDKGRHEASNGPIDYILFLPALDGPFRSSLQGNSSDELEFCIESGDPAVESSQFLEAVFINYGNNPFDLMKESMKILEKHMGTFSVREYKQKPAMLDWFGWCTWDAFYFDVNPQGIEEGLKSLLEGGAPARFLIIDDGWQDTANEFQNEGTQHGARLVSIKENTKFRSSQNVATNGAPKSLKDFVTTIKKNFGLKYVYVWHALMGYWGGVHPDAPETKKYNSKLIYPLESPGNLAHSRDVPIKCMEKYGVAMIDPNKALEFYNDLHSYLVSQNVDGVKVDVQNIPEILATGYGGRVSLTRRFQRALEKSIFKNFQDNNIICCMCHNTDSVYSSNASAVARASDDFIPNDPTLQTLHVATVAFNSIFLGEIVVPDWDMFHSLHNSAEFHAAARAVGGCGVYVSDKPNKHDFEVLKKLVLPDGSILRAKYPGRPTRDCLFNDPVMDGESLLKIWNLNTYTGVLGIFNCQGTGTWPNLNKNQIIPASKPKYLTGHISPSDIEYLGEVAGNGWTGDCAVYSFNSGSLYQLPRNGLLTVSLQVLQSEVFTITPIKRYNQSIQFAPIGLIKMYNSGGAVEAMDFFNTCQLTIKGRGSGLFGAYSNIKPKTCTVNSKNMEFQYDTRDKFLTLTIPLGVNSWETEICF
ncbi:probable galactinol--sucrose galactosyltransferase 2 [Elaeis guineensis]|uniref:galactinol--sucrose galactosyltransferase n=1 Tax=Elaeis guineensis var. tenera TaxID=51953 RepID=A0A6I9SGE8_ELAGV|nr:probable galactinol--sucrose galactosyltransferase 2 [Elaeis guineensis]